MSEAEKAPQPIFYPRDPSLDPQLVWQGKDEQDSQGLAVEARPVYTQEKIQPNSGPAMAKTISGKPGP